MPILTFECQCGWAADLLKPRDASSVPCPACGSTAQRQSVYRVGVIGFTPTPVTQRQVNLGKFLEASGELAYQHSRQTNIDGSEAPSPSLWTAAKAKAKRLEKLGVKDSSEMRSTV